MPQFTYFVAADPNMALTPEIRHEAGMNYMFDAPPAFNAVACGKGPGYARGFLIVTDGGRGQQPANIMYAPDSQTWREAPNGKFWIGLDNGAKPGPEDLIRNRPIPGTPVKLRDGEEWTVPIAMSFAGNCSLPMLLSTGGDGKWRQSIPPEFEKLCADGIKVFDAFQKQKDGRVTFPYDEGANLACDALTVNYRLGPMEVSMLGLLASDNMWDVLSALVDLDAVIRMATELDQKKT